MISIMFIVIAVVFGFFVYRKNMGLGVSTVIGVAAIVPHKAQADSMMEAIVDFVEENTEAELLEEEWEIR